MMCSLVFDLLILMAVGSTKTVRPSELMADPCQCVAPHMCIDDDLALNGQGLFDIRVIDGECENPKDICCDNVIKYPKSPVVVPAVQSLFNSCGFEAPLRPRILGEQNIILGEVPWTTAVLFKDPDTKLNIFKCGSSLIHPQVVMTAAHCVSDLETTRLSIRAGEVDTEDTTEVLPHQDRTVSEVTIHEQFDPTSLRNDIALIFLTEPFSMSANIRVVCLPSENLVTIGTSCIASGWGSDSFTTGIHSPTLKKVELPVISRGECLVQLRNTRLGPFFSLHRSFICAGGEKGKDTCRGDGGSPLVCPLQGQPDRFVQMGIVSWGIGCGSDSPGVYVNVNLFANWIDQQIMKRRLDVTVYKYR